MPISLWVIVLAAVNIAAYFLMWQDKQRAIRQQWRIPERTLLLLSLFGGFIGIHLGRQHFRHKTQRWYFNLTVIISAILWLVFPTYYFLYKG
jgi:raw score 6.39